VTAEANASATGDSGWTRDVTRRIFSTKRSSPHNSTRTSDDVTTNPVVIGNQSSGEMTTTSTLSRTSKDGNKFGSGWFLPPWIFNDSFAQQSLQEPPACKQRCSIFV